jgi:hypothetical protein
MALTMTRGKRQILFDFLPGRTFDFERVATIARVTEVRGNPQVALNAGLLLRRLEAHARAWEPEFRPALSDGVLADPSRFVFIDPTEVRSEMFPRVFWCQNRACGRVADYSSSDDVPPARCTRCREGKLGQVRWVKVHRCGNIEPLTPPRCERCHSDRDMALDTRRSERIFEFVWECRKDGWSTRVLDRVGNCRACSNWPASEDRRMRVDVHRAGTTFYAHSTVVVNVPHREYDALLSSPGWWSLTGARYLELAPYDTRRLAGMARTETRPAEEAPASVSEAELNDLLRAVATGKIDSAEVVARLAAAQARGAAEKKATTPDAVADRLVAASGVSAEVWEDAAPELLEYVAPHETGRPRGLSDGEVPVGARSEAGRLGLLSVDLIADYPILTATYGYSRSEHLPNKCRLNPFPSGRDGSSRYPVFVDEVQADALLLRLDPKRVLRWLDRNGFGATLPNGTEPELAHRAYFVELFAGVSTTQTINRSAPQARMAYGLLHTLSHLCIRHAALLCGLDRTSLSEYLLPRTLTAGIYCNHRFGATIGALTALFEQSLPEWLRTVSEDRRCAYDPVCSDSTGSCHACSHLAETSCRGFNLNLNRAFLFGGSDPHLGAIHHGYLDPGL